MEYYKPLTPNFRKEINDSIEKQMRELESCKETSFVNLYKNSFQALSWLINSLPDGYPMPMEM